MTTVDDVPNCGSENDYSRARPETFFTQQQWFSLPLALRQRWWRETDYSRNSPSENLLAAVRAALANT